MAAIVDMCWNSAEELFRDLDLDELYFRQSTIIGGHGRPEYPYRLLIHTGKITIGISLGSKADSLEEQAQILVEDENCQYEDFALWKLLRES